MADEQSGLNNDSAAPEREPPQLTKVVIIGGGCGGLAAAWALSKLNLDNNGEPLKEKRYHITVYEKSWRLGGKGASGRDAHGRVREHGLHIWLGFYENAFRMMRECYGVVEANHWGPKSKDRNKVLPHGTFDDAFFPEPHVGVATRRDEYSPWESWTGYLPPMKGLPGEDFDEETNPFTLTGYLARCIGLSKALMHSLIAPAHGAEAPAGEPRPDSRSALDEAMDLDFSFDASQSPSVVIDRIASLLRATLLTGAAGVLQVATIIENILREKNPAPQWSSSILKLLEALATETRKQLRAFIDADPHIRRKTEVIDLIITIVVGLYRDKVLFDKRGLDAINHIDCKDWLLEHGALQTSVNSPFVTGLYDLAFCYEDGDRKRPALAAGQALRGALRMFFTYRGSLFWRMRSGMGETVFSPMYRVLKARGVEFHFLQQLDEVRFEHLDKKGQASITQLRFMLHGTQELRDALDADPLDHHGCWLHTINQHRQYRPANNKAPTAKPQQHVLRRLRIGDHGPGFHAVVMAMGIVDFTHAMGEVFFKAPTMQHWQKMREYVKTNATQAAQAWLSKDLSQLGWRRGSVLISAFEEPFETWADMTHTLPSERRWRKAQRRAGKQDAARSVVYFCGLLSEETIAKHKGSNPAATTAKLQDHVRANLREMLASRMKPFWPDALTEPPGSALPLLVLEDGSVGGGDDKALKEQHVQANWSGSDRFTLAVPGSLDYRISPLDYSVVNMTIAGDWTECGFNESCVESAVMSGLVAAHAISGQPDLNEIIGYNHP